MRIFNHFLAICALNKQHALLSRDDLLACML